MTSHPTTDERFASKDEAYETGYREGNSSGRADWKFLFDEYPELGLRNLISLALKEKEEQMVKMLDIINQDDHGHEENIIRNLVKDELRHAITRIMNTSDV